MDGLGRSRRCRGGAPVNERYRLSTTVDRRTTMTGMRTATGIILIALGALGLAISEIVLLRLPLPGILLRQLGNFGFHIHPVESPVFSLVFLIVGVFLLLRLKQSSAT